MTLYNVTPASTPVVSTADLKAHLRVDHSDEDSLIAALQLAAVTHLEGLDGTLGRAMLEQTWQLKRDYFCAEIRIPLPPLMSLSSVKYYDIDDVLQTVPTDVYQVVGVGSTNPACIALKNGQAWPQVFRKSEAVVIEFVAGYASVPTPLIQAIKLLVGHWHQNREAVSVGVSAQELPMAVQALITPFIVHHFA